ncbi:MAG: sulfite exporter TauE/SafE family protein [Candidatus Diapherotrites archaeon]|nr:sulfite exporter TauE/SafE family protein [Candidatus Diapherotrites archaeon]
MVDLFLIGLLLFIGLITGFIDSVIGGGGLFSIPALIFLGFPPHVAVATDRFGTIGQGFAATWRFWNSGKIIWKYVPLLSIAALAGSIIGANLLLNIEVDLLKNIIGIVIVLLLPAVLLKPSIGIKRQETGNWKKTAGLIMYFLVMIFGGFIAQGTGPLVFFVLIYFFGFTVLEVLATKSIPWLLLSISSVIIFGLNGLIDYGSGLVLLAGMGIGGYIGANTALEKGEKWIKWLFIFFVLLSAFKLLLF